MLVVEYWNKNLVKTAANIGCGCLPEFRLI